MAKRIIIPGRKGAEVEPTFGKNELLNTKDTTSGLAQVAKTAKEMDDAGVPADISDALGKKMMRDVLADIVLKAKGLTLKTPKKTKSG
jgi:hypothetical protein